MRAVLTQDLAEGWGALGSGRADGAGASALLGTRRLQESTLCFRDRRAGPLVQEGRTWKECPGLLEQGWLGRLLVPEAMVGAHFPAWLGKHVLFTIAAVRFLRTSTSTASRVFWFLLYSVAGLGILV